MSIFNTCWQENSCQKDHEAEQNSRSSIVSIITADSTDRSNTSITQKTPLTRTKGISWIEFVFQTFSTNEGPAIFVSPVFFKNVGYLPGALGSLAVAVLYGYMMQIYFWCDDRIRTKKKIEKKQSLYSLVTNIFDEYNHPRIGSWLNFYLKYEIILSWTMGLSFNLLYATKNVQLILDYFNVQMTDQLVLLYLSIPTMLIFSFPHIRAITFFSYFIMITMIVVCLEVVFYLIIGTEQTANPRVVMINDLSMLPDFLFNTFFNLTCTAILFPLKNEMKYPSNLRKLFGGMNVSIFLIAILNMLFSLMTYFQLGDDVGENIISNLSQNQIVIVTIGLFVMGIIGGGALSFLVIFETLWIDGCDNLFSQCKYIKLYEYLVRSMLALFIILFAMVVPTFGSLINLVSCFSYPYDSILLPLILQSVIIWNDRQSDTKTVLILIKNVIISVICIAACLVAFYKSLTEIVSYYQFV